MIKQRAKLNTNRLNPKLKKELNDAESLKQAGFNPKTKQINPAVYGSTEPFNAVEAMKEDQNLNIVDEEFSNINITNYEKLTEQAMNAIEAERTSISTEQLTQETEASGVAPEVQAQQVIELPTDPKGKMEFIINQYPDVKFPSIDHLMGWKSIHNKIFFRNVKPTKKK